MTAGIRLWIAITCAGCLLVAGGCGLKGPLYLPDTGGKAGPSDGTSAPQPPAARRDTETPR